MNGETFWLVNLLMDMSLVSMTAVFIGKRVPRGKLLASGALGAVYAVLAIYAKGMLSGMVALVLAAFVMAVIAFGKDALMGGSVLILFGLLLMGLAQWLKKSVGEAASLGASFLMCWILPRLLLLGRRRCVGRYTITASWRGREMRFEGMVDTGNMLRDTVTGLPVIVAPAALLNLPDVQANLLPGMRLISVQTASGASLCPCFHPDRVEMSGAKGSKRVFAVIAVTRTALPRALIPAALRTTNEGRVDDAVPM